MALSNEEMQFRERMAEFIGSTTTNINQIKTDVDKIESKQDQDQRDIHSRINKSKDDCDNKIRSVEKAVTKLNLTIEVSRATIVAYGAMGGLAIAVIIWLLENYILN